MAKLIDVNPFKRGTSRHEEMLDSARKMNSPESQFKKIKNLCAVYCQNSRRNRLIALAVLFFIAVFFVFFSRFSPLAGSVFDKNKRQAVFLNNGQVYFGHLSPGGEDYLVLRDVYYLNVPQQAQSSAQQQTNVVKLGEEIYGPEDVMYIFKSQIAYWENMKTKSPVSEVIKKIEDSNKK